MAKSILKRSDLFEVLLNNSYDGVELVSRDIATNTIIEYYVNDRFLGWQKRSYAEMKKLDAYDISPKTQPNGNNSKEALISYFSELIENNRVNYPWTFIDANNEFFHTEVSIVGLKEEGIYTLVAIFRNVTQQAKDAKKIQDQLTELSEKNAQLEKYIESNMQLENFAYLASHDLKTPLRNIVSFSQLLEKSISSKLSDAEKEYLYFIKSGAKNMNSHISGLLQYAKYEYKDLVKVKLLVEEELNLVIEELKDDIEKYQISIEIGELSKYIVANRSSIYQLFYHLIKNAIYFKSETQNASIQISYTDLGEMHQFNIQDNGIGIDAEYFEQIFLLFKKLNVLEHNPGSGLGLAICKKIVELHKGNIWVTSELNKGSIFSFTLKK